MKKNIVVLHPFTEELLARLWDNFSVSYFPKGIESSAEFDAAIAEAEGLIVTAAPKLCVNRELLDRMPKLRAVSTTSVGYDHCDVEALKERGISLTSAPDLVPETTADVAFALILATARRVTELDKMVKSGKWTSPAPKEFFGVNISYKRIGIVGMGRIGCEVAKRAKGFGMSVLYSGPSRKMEAEQQYGAKYLPLDELLQKADFVCLTLKASEETRNLISREKLALMQPSSILVNVSRGFVMDEEALAIALKEKKILAAGLDVYATEPLPLTSPLMQLDNVVLLPHAGTATTETRYAMMACSVDNMIGALNGTLQKNYVLRA